MTRQNMTTQLDKANRALWAACMGSKRLIDDWRSQAALAVAQGQDINSFVAHAHPSNRRQAKAAFLLAQAQSNPQ